MKKAGLYVILMAVCVFWSRGSEAGGFIFLGYDFLNYTAKSLPADFRLVPIHEDDDYARKENNGVVEEGEEGYYSHGVLTFGFGKIWNRGKLDWGLGMHWIFNTSGKVYRRNYTNYPGTPARGEGAALTFVSTDINGVVPEMGSSLTDNFLLNFTPDIFAEYSFRKEENFKVGINLSYHSFDAVSGWDRYNAFEIDEGEVLAYVFPITGELTFFKVVTLGVTYKAYSETDFGKKSGLKMEDLSYAIKLKWQW